MMRTYREEYEYWMDSPALNDSEWQELSAIADDEKEIESRFFAPLSFGTAGLRGTMAVGLHRMNEHIIRWATQAFAELICSEGEEAKEKGIVIGYDCRINSERFAQVAASVMAANGVRVRLFSAMQPTPELSYAIIRYGAIAGINVTASHNPKEYNGYKVYWSDGGQLPPQHAEEVARKMESMDVFKSVKRMGYEEAMETGLIEMLGAEMDEAFLAEVEKMIIDREAVLKVADDFKLVYTPFHGTGAKLVPEALRRLGLKHIVCEPKQMQADGNFTTVESPNPENPEGFYLAAELAKSVGSDIIIGTDPDTDRVGVMARDTDGEYKVISGNKTGALLLDYIIKAKKAKGTMPEKPAFIKTIVTTNMGRVIAERNGVHAEETFTGFKFMAEKLAEYAETGAGYEYLLAYEESFGYMMGDFVRDKDAVTASVLLAEMAAYYHGRNMTLFDALDELYKEYGYYDEHTLNIVMPGLDGLADMAKLMADLRTAPPKEIGGVAVLAMRDYLDGRIWLSDLGPVDTTKIKGSNVLYFELADGSTFIVRPSGTEPKVKVYVLVQGEDAAECKAKLEGLVVFAGTLGK